MDAFWAAPPVSRTITALAFVESALVYGQLTNGYFILFDIWKILNFPPEIWRLVTPFLLTGPRFEFIFDLYALYTYSSALEKGSPIFSKPGDFFTYIIFVGTIITLTAGCLFGRRIFTSALIIALIYTFAQENRGKKVNFFVISIPVKYLPLAMLTVSLVINGWYYTLTDATGILAAHLYLFLVRFYPEYGGGRNYITTPNFIRRWFGAGQRQVNRTYGTSFRPPQQDSQNASRGWSSSITDSWSARGAGRRLGGN